MQSAPRRQPRQPPRQSRGSNTRKQTSTHIASPDSGGRPRDRRTAPIDRSTVASEAIHGKSSTDEATDLQAELEQRQAADEPLDITLGVEIECLLAVSHWGRPSRGDISPRSESGIDIVREGLAQELSARCATCGKNHKFHLQLAGVREWAGVRDHMVNYEGLSYGAWSLVGDPTVRPRKERAEVAELQYVDLHPVEIRSRILSLREPLLTRPSARDLSHTHSITYQEEITAVLTALDKAFNQWNELDQDTPIPSSIYSNESCGLHVHIGNGRKGFPYRTVRNIVSTYVANERQIDTMHSTNRIGGGKHPLMIQHNRFGCQYWDTTVITPGAYNMPWATHHHTSVYNRRGRAARDSPMLTHDFQESRYPARYLDDPEIRRAAFEYSCAAQLTLINRAPNLEALGHMQGSWSHNSTVNLENLPTREELGEGRERKLTMEFRQHAGTLSVTGVLAWINVVSNVVDFSHTVSDRDIGMLCAGQWSSPFHTTDSFLGTIGCAPKTIEHYRGRAGLRPGCPSYAQRRFDRTTNQPVMSFHPYKPTTALIRFLAHEHLRLNAPDEVQHRITKKFASGGYGQSPDWYLDQVRGIIDSTDLPDAREQLRIGWIDPRTQASHEPRPSPSARSLPRRPLRIANGAPSTSSSSDDEKSPQDTDDTKISDTSADTRPIKLAEGEIGAPFVRRARHEDTAVIQPAADQSAVHADRLEMVREEEQADESNGNRELRAVLADHDVHVPDGGRVQPFRGWRLLGARHCA